MLALRARLAIPAAAALSLLAACEPDDGGCSECARATERSRVVMTEIRDTFESFVIATSTTDTSLTTLEIDLPVMCVTGTAHIAGVVSGEVYDFMAGFHPSHGGLRVDFGDCTLAIDGGGFTVRGTGWSSLSGGAGGLEWWWTFHAASEDDFLVGGEDDPCEVDLVWDNANDSDILDGEWCGTPVHWKRPGDG